MVIVHPHLHPRRSGVTAHVELIARAQAALAEVKVLGQQLPDTLPHLTWGALWRRSGNERVLWHAHRNNELLWGALLRLLGRKLTVVYTSHSPRPVGRFTRFILRFADAVVTLNRIAAAWVHHPSTIVQHGVDLERFSPPVDRQAAFSALGWPGRLGIGVVGRVRPNKGQGDFVEALTPLLDAHPEWTPVLVGLAKGADAGWAEGLKAKTAGRLVLAGEHRDVVPFYRGLSILVHPSYAEAFSMVLIEAMAAGCCVVATRIAAVPEVIEDGKTGFLFDPGDVEGLRRILARLMADPALVASVGRAAREEAERRRGIAHEAKALLAVYEGAERARQ
ncbi:MAG: glycosyltransferase family 4 protein [Myxococcaceae bacterium]|nr:glycosyltransferase family 4 protein [Myxococcaceae bacterium]